MHVMKCIRNVAASRRHIWLQLLNNFFLHLVCALNSQLYLIDVLLWSFYSPQSCCHCLAQYQQKVIGGST
jgi:hypothetical protein